MERKQGFFSALRDEVVRGLSPARSSRSRSQSRSPRRRKSLSPSPSPVAFFWRWKRAAAPSTIDRSGSLRPIGETLTPLMEGPDPDAGAGGLNSRRSGIMIGQWMRGQLLSRAPSLSHRSSPSSDLRLLLGVLAAPLAPVPLTPPLPPFNKNSSIETSSAQYILEQYTAACGGKKKLQSPITNAYAMGKVKMIATEMETANKIVKNKNAESGGFVLWQMNPDMWYVELAVGGCKVHAGCNGGMVWRHTPWHGSHTAKGPVRPLRRALQGLDPRTTARIFSESRCIGEKTINGEECFILKLCADAETLKWRSEGPAEIIRHVLFGYFSQRTGFLIHLEDSHLTRIQNNGGDAVYWETTINSSLFDYREVEGVMVAHSGHSMVTLFRFGEMAMSQSKTRMEEAWTIEEVAFNVPGLSFDCFIPPADLTPVASMADSCNICSSQGGKRNPGAVSAKVAALKMED